ncbi:MAG: hypothetical protein IKP12_05630 [Acholeplasmatales bacterium]|nr:hypothetical protein [Acholeplasmatales bacterium]
MKKNKNKDKNVINTENFDIKTEEEKEAELKAKKEEKKAKSPVKVYSTYKFIFFMIVFAILVTFGIMILIFRDNATGAIYLVTALVAGIAALIRLIPLMKTTRSKRAKLVSLIEIIFHGVVAVYLVIAALVLWGQVNSEDFKTNGYNWFNKFNFDAYKYILIALLATRSLVYYYVTIDCKEGTDKTKFYFHTIINVTAIVLGCIPFDSKQVPLVLAIISFISALVIGGEAGGGYFRYRKSIAKPKEDKKKVEDQIEAPAKEEDKKIEDIDPNTIPVSDDTPSDQAVM